MGTPIISLYNSVRIGEILDFIVDPDIGKVVGVIGETTGIFKKRNKIISVIDIRELSKQALIVDSEDVLVWQDEVVKIDNILKSKVKLFGNKVFTESGKYLGKVSDFLIDQLFYLAKLYVDPPLSNIFSTQLIISRDLILKITKNEIIVSDSLIEPEKETEIAEAIE